MNAPEVEVRSFKQQGGESLKDAWYRISDAHHRCTKKYSTMILLRNFYVGITSWYRYVLDTLTGGNFLGTPALEARNIIESLVGVPPIKTLETEVTLEDIMNRLNAMEKNLPTPLDISEMDESIVKIDKRVTILEANNTKDNQNLRIGDLEEAMETISSTFSSLKFKSKKVPSGKEQRFIYVPKAPKPRTNDATKGDANEATLEILKVPIMKNSVLGNTFDEFDASSLGNT